MSHTTTLKVAPALIPHLKFVAALLRELNGRGAEPRKTFQEFIDEGRLDSRAMVLLGAHWCHLFRPVLSPLLVRTIERSVEAADGGYALDEPDMHEMRREHERARQAAVDVEYEPEFASGRIDVEHDLVAQLTRLTGVDLHAPFHLSAIVGRIRSASEYEFGPSMWTSRLLPRMAVSLAFACGTGLELSPDYRSGTVIGLARHMYATNDFSATPIMADALQDAGCPDDHVVIGMMRNPTTARLGPEWFRGAKPIDFLMGA